MRLTLRTLLAYRDRVLKPAELEDMHARVQQSAMAGNLLKRIESLSHRPTILAPPIEGKGLGADANSIAEYLDDALKGEKVPELERICLESDVQLAELAQCHQLLSTALSTSVDVPPTLRDRIMSLGDSTARAEALAASPTDYLGQPAASDLSYDATTARSAQGKARFRTDETHRPTATDTQRTEKLSVASASAMAGATSDQAMPGGGKRLRTDLADPRLRDQAHRVEAPMVASGGESIRPTGLDLEGSQLAHEVPEYLRGRSRDGWRGPLAIGGLLAVLTLLVWQLVGSWEVVREMLASRAPTAAENSSSDSASSQNNDPANIVEGALASNAGKSGVVTGSAATLNANAGGVANTGTTSNTTPGTDRVLDDPSTDQSTAQVDAAPAAQQVPAVPSLAPSADLDPVSPAVPRLTQPLGLYAAQWLPADAQAMQAVAFVQTSGAQGLHRLQAAEQLPSGSQIFVPPANRMKLDLNGGLLWGVCGASQMSISLPEAGSQPQPRIDLRLGKALVTAGSRTAAAIAPKLWIIAPGSQVEVTLGEPTSQVAVELAYTAASPGPMTDRKFNPPVLRLTAIDGAVRVGVDSLSAGGAVTLAAGQTAAVLSGAITLAQDAPLPTWIDATADRPIDALAAVDMHRQIASSEPLGAVLLTLASNRRPETRALAAQTLALLGNWDWLSAEKNTLSDARDRSYWTPLIDLGRQVVAANPENAAALRTALISADADRGAYQADLWIGLAPGRLDNDGLTKLVETLSSNSLLDRILAIHQLQRMTGKDLGYQAGEINRASIQQWNRELASGRLQANTSSQP